MDMVNRRLQLANSGYKGVWDCVKRVMSEEGLGILKSDKVEGFEFLKFNKIEGLISNNVFCNIALLKVAHRGNRSP